MIKLYSTGCPACKILKNKLDEKQIKYVVVDDIDLMMSMGIKQVPLLEADGLLLDFRQAAEWIKERETYNEH